MGTYYSLMNDAANRGEDYEFLDSIPDVLRKLEEGKASQEEVSKVLGVLAKFELRVRALVDQAAVTQAVEERTRQTQGVLKHLKDLKTKIQAAAKSSLNVADM